MTKICNKCGLEKEFSEFYKRKKWFSGNCKKCDNEINNTYRQKNKLRVRELRLKSYYKNKEKVLKRTKIYREKNKTKIALYKKEWYEKNKERLLLKIKKYRQTNSEKVRATQENCYKKRREHYREYKRVWQNKALKRQMNTLIYAKRLLVKNSSLLSVENIPDNLAAVKLLQLNLKRLKNVKASSI